MVGPETQGVTDSQIMIGLAYASDADEANAALGFSGVTTGDQHQQHEMMIRRLNEAGGVLGREVVPVYYVLDNARTQTMTVEQIAQEQCATWTEDNEVYAVAHFASNETLRECLDNAGVPLMTVEALSTSDHEVFRQYPLYTEPTMMPLDDAARITIAGLQAQGYFEATDPVLPVKVGVLTYDADPFRRAMDGAFLPGLAAAGYPAPVTIYVTPAESNSQLGDMAAQVSSAVLRMRTENVTHVLILDAAGLLTVLFLQNADNQGYRPRYGFNSNNGTQTLISAGLVRPDQTPGALAVGWVDQHDVLEVGSWPSRQRCFDVYAEEGIAPSSRNAEVVASIFCDIYGMLRASLEAAPLPLTPASLTGGVEALGTTFEPALSPGLRLGPDHHAGAYLYHYNTLDTGCGCWVHADGPFEMD